MKRLLYILLLLPCFLRAQQHPDSLIFTPFYTAGSGDINPGAITLPVEYWNTSKYYRLVMFCHGAVQGGALDGSQLSNLWASSPNPSDGGVEYLIHNGLMPDSVYNPVTKMYEQTIYYSPQLPFGGSATGIEIYYMLKDLVKRFRIDTNAICLTGLSDGAWGITDYTGHFDPNHGTFTPDYKAAVAVSMSQADGASNTVAVIAANDSVHYWAFGQAGSTNTDAHGVASLQFSDDMNAQSSGISRFTNYSGTSIHCCWGTFYAFSYTETFDGFTQNIYNYMTRFNRVSALACHAGSDTSTTGTSFTLAGWIDAPNYSTVNSVTWTKISGPSTPTFGRPNNITTGVTGLVPGTYVFRLTTVGNLTTATDDISVTINAGGSTPTANAGPDQTLNLPTNHTVLDGTGSTVSGGTIASYHWAKGSGPSTYTIASPSGPTTALTGLVLGTYTFGLTITDNNGNTSTDSVAITVKPYGQCGGANYPANISADFQGFNFSMSSAWALKPGDTITISSAHIWSYFTGQNIYGTEGCPITVINDGVNLVEMTAGIAFTNCAYMHITGSGGTPGRVYPTTIPGDTSHHTNGIYIFQYDSVSGPARGNSLQIDGVTSFMQIDHIDEYARAYIMWCKNEASCADSLTFAPWKALYSRIHDIDVGFIHAKNINQDGFYFGTTSPDGQRHVTCGGIDSTPIPPRMYNIHIHDCYGDSIGRTGLQLSGADSGFNEIDHDTLTRTGFEFNVTQGGGIILGGYSQGYVHDNYVRYTYQHGINNLGAGLVRVENNDIDSSGWLAGSSNLGFSNIAGTTLQTTNHGWTPAGINTTYLIKNNKLGVGTNNTGSPQINVAYGVGTWNTNNVVCGNTLQNGTPVTGITIQSPIVYSTNCTITPVPCQCAQVNKNINFPH